MGTFTAGWTQAAGATLSLRRVQIKGNIVCLSRYQGICFTCPTMCSCRSLLCTSVTAHLQLISLHDGLQLGLERRPQTALLLLGGPKAWLLVLLLGCTESRVLLLGGAKSRVLLLGGAKLRLTHARLPCTCRPAT